METNADEMLTMESDMKGGGILHATMPPHHPSSLHGHSTSPYGALGSLSMMNLGQSQLTSHQNSVQQHHLLGHQQQQQQQQQQGQSPMNGSALMSNAVHNAALGSGLSSLQNFLQTNRLDTDATGAVLQMQQDGTLAAALAARGGEHAPDDHNRYESEVSVG